MNYLKKIHIALILLLIFSANLGAEQGLIVPKKGTVYHALLEGLKLLAVGDIEQWISGSCDGIRLCSNTADIDHIRNHRAKVQEKIATSCLKKGGEALDIDHVVGNPEIDIAVKIYLLCDEKGPPRFYSLRRTMDYWFFISL
ncbi:MAG: hypothetical protein HND53_05590 [Proteobacteria bacterium]|nr:hypothetical protein [Pseudomonadota bacterium]NOG59955.1 hypothetical protein [Pseudomonadota bacterium]